MVVYGSPPLEYAVSLQWPVQAVKPTILLPLNARRQLVRETLLEEILQLEFVNNAHKILFSMEQQGYAKSKKIVVIFPHLFGQILVHAVRVNPIGIR